MYELIHSNSNHRAANSFYWKKYLPSSVSVLSNLTKSKDFYDFDQYLNGRLQTEKWFFHISQNYLYQREFSNEIQYYDFKVWIESDVKAVPQSYLGPKTGTWIEI